jgi:peptidoglycan/xylan/chitin deacetylase (PgdA/CDA1 family)
MRRVAGRLERGARGVVLLYHRIDAPVTDPWQLAVTPERFAEHLEVLAGAFRPVTLDELLDGVRRGRVPARAVAITFDDGYADNLHRALPLLERRGVPATVYVTAGHADGAPEFWWKQLEGLLLEPGRLPPRLAVDVDGFRWAWELGSCAELSSDRARRDRAWCVADAGPPPSPRHAAFRSLLERLEPVPEPHRDAILAALFAAAGAPRSARPSHRLLRADEIRRLAAGGLVDVGAHTLTHPRLGRLPVARQHAEVAGSKARLEAILDRPVTTFTYPFGTPRDFDADTVRVVREARFASAAAVSDRAVSPSSDPFQLPRVGVVDWTGEELERRMERWLRRWL